MTLLPGHYYPRIGKGPWSHRSSPYNDALVSAHQQILLLHEDLNKIFTFVHPDSSQSSVFGHHIRNLLILAATEFEAQCVGILKANNALSNGQHFNTIDYVKLNAAMKLNEYELRLSMFPDYPTIRPFASWDVSAPTQSLGWYDAYNKTKHNREMEFSTATLGSAVSSVAAITAMFMAQVLGTDCNSPTLMLPRTFVCAAWPNFTSEGYYTQPADRTTWIAVDYPF